MLTHIPAAELLTDARHGLRHGLVFQTRQLVAGMDTTPLRPGRRTTTRYLPVRETALNLVWYRRYELGGTRIYTELPTPPDEAELVRSPDAPVFAAS